MKRQICSLPLVLLMVGCTDGGGSIFDVKFDRLDVQEVNFEEAEADFVFRIENRTPLGFQVDRFDYALAFEQIEWLSGDKPDGLALYADDFSEVSLPVNIVFQDLFDLVQATRGKDTIDFGLDGNFGIRLSQDTILPEREDGDTGAAADSGLAADEEVSNAAVGDVISIPYDAGGDFPALRRPRFSFKRVKVGSFDWTNLVVPIELKLDVDNEHGSSLFFTNFSYDLDIEGVSVASGLVDDLGEVLGASDSDEAGAAGTGVLTLPINVDLAGLGTSVINILSGGGGKLNLGLAATTDVDTPFGVVTLAIDETGDVSVD